MLLDESTRFCSSPLPELFPELAGIDSVPEKNSNRSEPCFNNLRVRAKEPDSSVSGTGSSSQAGSQLLINRNISPSLLVSYIESNPTDSGVQELTYNHNVSPQFPNHPDSGKPYCADLASCEKEREPSGATSTNRGYTGKHQKCSTLNENKCMTIRFLNKNQNSRGLGAGEYMISFGHLLSTKSSSCLERKENQGATNLQRRDYMRDHIKIMESSILKDELDTIRKTKMLIKFDVTRKKKEASSYLLEKNDSHHLVQKYGANELANWFYSYTQPNILFRELKDFTNLKRSVCRSIGMMETTAIESEYFNSLKSACESNSRS
ncbi:hypothetical protein [Endozoicomonas sp.]|uniref:hypothetical protein n=1 Tax=Endozoicomonas sp. TaxID=1892382 RepID=UPI00383A2743